MKVIAAPFRTPGRRIFPAVVLIGLALLQGSCGGGETEPVLIRLMDVLTAEDLIRSPICDNPPPASESDAIEQILNDPRYEYLDMNAAEPPLRVMRKLYNGRTAFNAIFAPPITEFVHSLVVPEGAVLEFGCGLLVNPETNRSDAVAFSITLETNRKNRTLFQRTTAAPASADKVPYRLHTIPLKAWSGRRVTLRFATHDPDHPRQKPVNPAPAFWAHPLIYGPRDSVKSSPVRPNIVLMVIDTLRADHLGCYGYERNTSPNIDRLARESVLFSRAFSSASWTLPAHVSLFTSVCTCRHGVFRKDARIPKNLATLAGILRREGYFTAGVCGGAFVHSRYGFAKGFEVFVDHGRWSSREAQKLYTFLKPTLDWIRDRPFFLFIHTYQVHSPYKSPPEYTRRFVAPEDPWQKLEITRYLNQTQEPLSPDQRRNIVGLYDAEILYTDEMLIAPLLARLRKRNLYDDTWLVLTSDHGEEFFDHGGWVHGHTLYNELIRIPLLVKFPHGRHAGKRIGHVVGITDIMPSLLAALNLPGPEYPLDGRTIDIFLDRTTGEDHRLIAERYSGPPQSSPLPLTSRYLKGFALIENSMKMIYDPSHTHVPPEEDAAPPHEAGSPYQLYDLENDFAERRDIAPDEPGWIDVLLQKVKKFYRGNHRLLFQARQSPLSREEMDQLKALGYIQ